MRIVFLLAAIAVASAIAAGQNKTAEPTAEKRPFANSLQAFVVVTENESAFQGRGRLFERKGPRSKWRSVGDDFPVVIGRNGLAWAADSAPEAVSVFKVEGDGRSPAGMFPLTASFGRAERESFNSLPYTKLGDFTECVDDPASSHYNRIVDRMQVGNFDWKSSEKMLEMGMVYDLGINVGYNSYPVIKGGGSCIFLHIWADSATGTAGCTAMKREDLQRVLAWADPERSPYLVQMTATDLKEFRKAWDLPKMK